MHFYGRLSKIHPLPVLENLDLGDRMNFPQGRPILPQVRSVFGIKQCPTAYTNSLIGSPTVQGSSLSTSDEFVESAVRSQQRWKSLGHHRSRLSFPLERRIRVS
jgi:hypothetical protein